MDTMLILNLDPAMEEDLVDYLLQLEFVNGFTSYPVRGHGRDGSMSVAEQVTGRRKRHQVEILLAAAAVPAVLEGLADNVGRDITWWQQTVAAYGRIA